MLSHVDAPCGHDIGHLRVLFVFYSADGSDQWNHLVGIQRVQDVVWRQACQGTHAGSIELLVASFGIRVPFSQHLCHRVPISSPHQFSYGDEGRAIPIDRIAELVHLGVGLLWSEALPYPPCPTQFQGIVVFHFSFLVFSFIYSRARTDASRCCQGSHQGREHLQEELSKLLSCFLFHFVFLFLPRSVFGY